jgi:hypothetical protein
MNIWKGAKYYQETTIKGLENSKIPKAVILNKEYGGALPSKLGWIKDINADIAFTYHHDHNMFEKITGTPFHHLPFAADPLMFKSYGITPKHDIGFTGGLGHTGTNGWEKISKLGMIHPTVPGVNKGQGWSHTLRRQIKERHEEWSDVDFYFSNHHHDNIKDYAKRLCTAKMWLSTTGPVDIVGTRYFEVPLTNTTMLVCNRSTKMWCFDEDCNRSDKNVDVYENLFEEDKHYVAFETPEELIEKVRYYKDNESERRQIVDQAYLHTIDHHTWNNRAETFIKCIEGL